MGRPDEGHCLQCQQPVSHLHKYCVRCGMQNQNFSESLFLSEMRISFADYLAEGCNIGKHDVSPKESHPYCFACGKRVK